MTLTGRQEPVAPRPVTFLLDADGNEIMHVGPGRAERRREERDHRRMVGRFKAERHAPPVRRVHVFLDPPYHEIVKARWKAASR